MNLNQLLRDLYEYFALKRKKQTAAHELASHELARLLALKRLFESPSKGLSRLQRRNYRRFDVRIPALLEDAGYLTDVTVVSLSAGGLSLLPAAHLAPGDIAHVRISDPTIARTYRLTVKAVHRPHEAFLSSLGLAFVERPAEPPLRPEPPVRLMTVNPVDRPRRN